MALDDINDMVGSGGPIHKIRVVGDKLKGTVAGGEVRDSTDTDGKVKHFADGRPMKTIIVEFESVEVAVTDGAPVEYEDNQCRYFFSGWQQQALTVAIAGTESRKLNVGDTLAIKCTELKKNPKGGLPIKEITVSITPGVKVVVPVDLDEF
jgi:hypothetical protein